MKAIEKIELRNITFSYNKTDLVFKNLNHLVPLNSIISISGPVGTGKNTFLKLLAGLEDPSEGEILVNGKDLLQESESGRFSYRRLLGFGFSQGGLLQNRTLKENLNLALDHLTNWGSKEKNSRLEEMMARFNLKIYENERPGALSGGVRMASCVVRAFLHNPQMILLSNPTSGLSADLKNTLIGLIQEQVQKKNLRHIFLVSDDDWFLKELKAKRMILNSTQLEAA